jgi:sec-independent protein translocase protein TatA
MTTTFAAFLGGWEIVLILAVVLILFGAKKLPELAKGLGQGIREFKKASSEVTRELERVGEEESYAQRQKMIDASTSGEPGHWTEKFAGSEKVTSPSQPASQPNQQKP